eukprot:3872173-Prymnesium_polylepis.2
MPLWAFFALLGLHLVRRLHRARAYSVQLYAAAAALLAFAAHPAVLAYANAAALLAFVAPFAVLAH